jgi:hypothetical protein
MPRTQNQQCHNSCILWLQVVALRSSQLKAEQALAETAAAEAKLEEAGQQLATVRAQLTTETARAQQLAAQMGAAKEAEKVGGAVQTSSSCYGIFVNCMMCMCRMCKCNLETLLLCSLHAAGDTLPTAAYANTCMLLL